MEGKVEKLQSLLWGDGHSSIFKISYFSFSFPVLRCNGFTSMQTVGDYTHSGHSFTHAADMYCILTRNMLMRRCNLCAAANLLENY